MILLKKIRVITTVYQILISTPVNGSQAVTHSVMNLAS